MRENIVTDLPRNYLKSRFLKNKSLLTWHDERPTPIYAELFRFQGIL